MIMTVVFIVAGVFTGLAAGFAAGCGHNRARTVELSDVLKANIKRSGRQVLQDGVMQLKNEIAASGAVRQETLENGDIRVTLKVVV